MNSLGPVEILFLAAILIIPMAITFGTVGHDVQRIRKIVAAKGAKEINVSWQWLDFDRSNHTFSVEYVDQQDVKHNTTCKIHVWGSDIYWKDQP